MPNATTQHALRALVRLARAREGAITLGRDLAEQAGIPANYLAKILLTLGKAGLVEATRGQGGGYRLARGAAEIRLIEVLDLFEGAARQTACFLGENRACNDRDGCSAHAAWKHVQMEYLEFLRTQTIADIGGTGPRPRSRQRSLTKSAARSRNRS
jgi:Rrf2 family iron-sulfur cluster assembly transcriptional regulator